MTSATSLRVEQAAPVLRSTARSAAPVGDWVIYSGAVPVLTCKDEDSARRLVRAVEERLAQRDER